MHHITKRQENGWEKGCKVLNVFLEKLSENRRPLKSKSPLKEKREGCANEMKKGNNKGVVFQALKTELLCWVLSAGSGQRPNGPTFFLKLFSSTCLIF